MTHRTKLSSWVWMVAAATFFAIGLGGVASAMGLFRSSIREPAPVAWRSDRWSLARA